MDYFNPVETWSRDRLADLQLYKLKESLRRARKSHFYANRFLSTGFDLNEIRTLDDATNIPFTTKDDLRAAYPLQMAAVPQERLVRLHASSGTTGAPTVVVHTQHDLDAWGELMARSMWMVGMRPKDVFQNMSGYGLFTGGLGIHYGAERLGALVIPAGAGNTMRQLRLLRDFKVTVAHIIPSYALYTAEIMTKEGVSAEELSLTTLLIGAEPHTDEARRQIEALYRCKAYNSYGLSEMNGPGVAFECPEQNGLHLWEDAFFAEILDPETGVPVADGEYGELVMTTLDREGMPIIRYKTRDLTRFLPGDCPCGRKHRRIERIRGRCDDMFIIKGVNIFPMQIEQALLSLPEVGRNYLIILERKGPMDDLKIQVEIKEECFVEDMRALEGLRKKIAHTLQGEILVTPKIELVQSNSLPRSEGKAIRVLDLRNPS